MEAYLSRDGNVFKDLDGNKIQIEDDIYMKFSDDPLFYDDSSWKRWISPEVDPVNGV